MHSCIIGGSFLVLSLCLETTYESRSGAARCVASWLGCAQPDQDKIKWAKIHVQTLAKASEIFKTRYGAYPPTLKSLTEMQPGGVPALLPVEGLIDPWLRPYQYDPKQLDPKTNYPLVWSEGPDPKDKKGKIMNWVPKEMPVKK